VIARSARPHIEPERHGFISHHHRQIYWEYFGRGDREAVCLLNGLAMSTRSWNSFLPFLLDAHDVLLYDFLGQGRSSCEDEPYAIPAFADCLASILDVLNIPRINLMGISYGGFVALEFARLHGRRLRTLILSGILLSHEELFQRYQDLSLRFYRGGRFGFELYTHYMYEKIFAESFLRSAKPHLEPMRERFCELYENRVHCLIRLTEAQLPFFRDLDTNMPAYQAIRTPTLILAGSEDRVILPAVQAKLSTILSNASFATIGGAGHMVYLEQPQRFFGLVKRFIGAQAEVSS
jgi:3-oxoadipate enol-lactonase